MKIFNPAKAKKVQEAIKQRITNHVPVPGVTYRISPKTGLYRAVKPKPVKTDGSIGGG